MADLVAVLERVDLEEADRTLPEVHVLANQDPTDQDPTNQDPTNQQDQLESAVMAKNQRQIVVFRVIEEALQVSNRVMNVSAIARFPIVEKMNIAQSIGISLKIQ